MAAQGVGDLNLRFACNVADLKRELLSRLSYSLALARAINDQQFNFNVTFEHGCVLRFRVSFDSLCSPGRGAQLLGNIGNRLNIMVYWLM